MYTRTYSFTLGLKKRRRKEFLPGTQGKLGLAVTSSIPGLHTPVCRTSPSQQQVRHLQNHLVHKLARKGGAVPQALGFLPGLKSGQPESFCWGSGPLLASSSLRCVRGLGVQGSMPLGARGAAGSGLRGRRGRTPAAGAPGAAPPAVNVAGPLLVHGSLSGRRVCPGLPDETDLHVESREGL